MTPRSNIVRHRMMFALAAPALSILAATIFISAMPLPLAWGMMPDFPLLFVIIWGVLQPRLLPAWLALVLGMVADAATGMPLGVRTLVFPLIIVTIQFSLTRLILRHLWVDWVAAAMLILLSQLLVWQLMAFLLQPVALAPLLAQAGVTILAFPVTVILAVRIQRALVKWAD